jgi:hypothetical protein
MSLFAVSDATITMWSFLDMAPLASTNVYQMLSVLFSVIGTIVTSYLAYMIARMNFNLGSGVKSAQEASIVAAQKVEQVQNDLESRAKAGDRRLDSLAVVAHSTHVLVNNNMAVQLALNMSVTKRLADITNDQSDIDAYNHSSKMYYNHMERQAVVDEQLKAWEDNYGPSGDTPK